MTGPLNIIAEGHGGRIAIASEGEDKGTTVRLLLPIVAGSA